MKYDVFRKISKTVTYKGAFKFLKDGKVLIKAIFWTNTNKLLEKSNIIGVKTGITNKAGGCLATAFKIDKN
jgi:D-alanyl-D-alanine carboxypeptidase